MAQGDTMEIQPFVVDVQQPLLDDPAVKQASIVGHLPRNH